MFFTRSTLALLSASCLASAAFAQAPAAPAANAPVTRDQIPALVKDALVNNPDILNEAIKKLQEKQEEDAKAQAREAIGKNKDALFSNADSPVVGNASGDVTIVEFFDYHCGYCKQLFPSISQLLDEDKKIRVIFKEFPVLSEDSVTASRAALAISRIAKDKYFAFHSELMSASGKFDEKAIGAIAKKLDIDMTKLKAEMAKPEIAAMLDKNRELGEALGVHGTPAIVIGNDLFPGAMPYADLKKAVETARSKPATPAAKAPAPAAPAAAPAPTAAPAPAPTAAVPAPATPAKP